MSFQHILISMNCRFLCFDMTDDMVTSSYNSVQLRNSDLFPTTPLALLTVFSLYLNPQRHMVLIYNCNTVFTTCHFLLFFSVFLSRFHHHDFHRNQHFSISTEFPYCHFRYHELHVFTVFIIIPSNL
jgi:hypothetical protein